MKGYDIKSGYMGWIPSENRYREFATEREYEEYFEDECCWDQKT